jgi:N-acylglucosamine 2-epimerase
MNSRRIEELIAIHRDGLLLDTIPFWMKHGLDPEHGGLRNFLDQDGSVYHHDKAVWQTGRFGWITALLHNEVEPRAEWLAASRSCCEFLRHHCFDADGRMYFEVTRQGVPVRKRRYAISENFCAMAWSEYARATGDDAYRSRVLDLYARILHYYRHPEIFPPKYEPAAGLRRSHGNTMIQLALAQQLRRLGDDPLFDRAADDAYEDLQRYFMHADVQCVLETVGGNGERLDSPAGRCVNPGHAIETAWFLMEEARLRNKPDMLRTGLTILDWSLTLGWDQQYGGIFYFVDIEGKPLEQYEHDMKLAWPHNEALVACLLAYALTGDVKYERWYELVHEWTYAHFPDRLHGDWFKYLHRDGSLASTRKGSHWVSCFHLPRQQFVCWKILERLAAQA